MSSYTEFKLAEQKPKTAVYHVLSKRYGDILGEIKWYAPWRQYCFFPNLKADFLTFSAGCMLDIVEFIRKLMEERKMKR